MKKQSKLLIKKSKTNPFIFVFILCILLFLSCTTTRNPDVFSLKAHIFVPQQYPDILYLKIKNSRLLYYGVSHTVNPNDPQIKAIEEQWNNFSPTVAFCEGYVWPLENEKNEAIRKYGEQGLLRYLSARDNVSFRCIDPSLAQQTRYLLKSFSPTQIKIYYVTREALITGKRFLDEMDGEYGRRLLLQLQSFRHLKGPPASIFEINNYIAEQFPELKNWKSVPASYFQKIEEGKILARIHRNLTHFRNKVMLAKLLDALEKNNERIFALVGRSHIVAQKQTLLSHTYQN